MDSLLLLLRQDVPESAVRALIQQVDGFGCASVLHEHLLGPGCHGLSVRGELTQDHLSMLNGVRAVRRIVESRQAFHLVARSHGAQATRVRVGTGEVGFGPRGLCLIAGPCAIEELERTVTLARSLAAAGACLLRGGAFKPRTSPYAFQGLGEAGIQILVEVRRQTHMPFVTEVLDPRDVERVAEHADMLQVGSRNQQNFPLLREVGRHRKPVLLKRGVACTLDEFLQAAEYIANEGNQQIVLCERGVRSFDPATRNLLDLAAVPALRRRTHLPIVVDPSHGTGAHELVPAMAKAAVAAGCDGVMLEVHPNPGESLSDGRQALLPDEFAGLAPLLFAHAKLEGRQPVRAGTDVAVRVSVSGSGALEDAR
jgi:3-deoxy-7-phosphoheptulonate synthase